MNSIETSTKGDVQTTRMKTRNSQSLRLIQTLSRVVTLIFIAALIYAVYQALVNGNPLPIWAWLGVLALFAMAVGLVVMAVVYRGVSRQVGPFDYRPSTRVTGEIKSESRSVESGGASSLHADIKMTEGVFQLMGGAADIMQAIFVYDDADWKPPGVEYAVDADGQGILHVEQKATGRPAMRQGRCEWLVRLNQDIPTELNIRFGAGKAELKLGSMALERLRVESGVGELVIDLNGEWHKDVQVDVKSGIGDTVLRLPKEVGVRVQPQVGFGSLHTDGLTWDGEAYTNQLFGQAPVAIEITVEGGMGKVTLEQTG